MARALQQGRRVQSCRAILAVHMKSEVRSQQFRNIPASSGDLFRSPGWSFRFSLISRIVPEIGAYCVPGLVENKEGIQRHSIRKIARQKN